MSDPLILGVERCVAQPPDVLRQAKRFGLLCNQSSLDRDLRNAHDVLRERFGAQLAALFSPQHGLWSTEQDNMIESAHGAHAGLPVHSLYGHDAASPAGQGGNRSLQRPAPPTEHGHVMAGGDEALGDPGADAGAAAGDETAQPPGTARHRAFSAVMASTASTSLPMPAATSSTRASYI